MKKMSAQLKWQRKKISEGKCPSCGNDHTGTHYNCEACHQRIVDRMRVYMRDRRKGKK